MPQRCICILNKIEFSVGLENVLVKNPIQNLVQVSSQNDFYFIERNEIRRLKAIFCKRMQNHISCKMAETQLQHKCIHMIIIYTVDFQIGKFKFIISYSILTQGGGGESSQAPA